MLAKWPIRYKLCLMLLLLLIDGSRKAPAGVEASCLRFQKRCIGRRGSLSLPKTPPPASSE